MAISTYRRQRLIELLTKQQGGKCCYCGVKVIDGSQSLTKFLGGSKSDYNDKAVASLEHKLPKAMGGTDDASNLAVSCRGCNIEKRDKFTHEEFTRKKAG
jgi:hypothetical protein